MELNKNMFREYDIRGIYGTDLNGDIAYLIGRGLGSKMHKLNIVKTVVAYDNRLSSVELEKNLVKGLIESGINVYRLGLASTPMCYYASNYFDVNCSVMITASHNPKEYNGFKFSFDGISNACGSSVMEIYDIIINKDFVNGNGTISNVDIEDAYINLLTNNIDLPKKLKIVYDCGNGTTSIIAKKIFDRLNVEYIPLYDISDGSFPNHHPDPSVEENLRDLEKTVVQNKASLGIAFDGDGDRVGVVDEKGNMIDIDKYLIIMWKYLVNRVEKKVAFFDVKCSKVLEDELIKLGVKPIETRTGNSYTRRISAEGDYILGGELSGHVYFRDKFPGYDDGIYAGIRLIEAISNLNVELSSMLEGINKYYSTKENKIAVDDSIKFDIVDKVKEYCISKGYKFITLDGVKVKYDDGFALVRASNTGPNITTRYEAKTESRLEEITNEFNNLIYSLLNK